jgi:ATP adenylyltransferase
MADKSIWSPWRSGFILAGKEKGCIFCRLARDRTAGIKNLVLHRTDTAFIVMNKFPYNAGHLLIVPRRHVGLIEKLSAAESKELMHLSQMAVAAMKRALKPKAFNLGMNLGRLAGAGIPGHLHMHIVPRWTGDSNFMPTIGNVRVHSIPLDLLYRRLAEEFDTV